MNFTIKTLGCKVNNYESEMIKEQLLSFGYSFVERNVDANIIIINTCTVTNNADSKSMQMIRNARKENSLAILIVCGCMLESKKNDLDSISADIIIGSQDKSKIIKYINEFKTKHEKIISFYNLQETSFEEMKVNNYSSKTRGFIKIQDGCDNYCTYCIIPYVRGRSRSKNFEYAIKEIENLSLAHNEIVLTGIHTGSYNDSGKDLTDLIQEISKLDNVKRIRISSIEITELSEKFLKELKNNPKICNHLHIPLQSGSNKILKKMNRKYDINYYIEKVNAIRKIRSIINLTTDLIIGFPSETEDDFNETTNNLNKINFSKIHVFPYSIREKTVASKMNEQIPNNIKKERVRKIIELSNEYEESYYKQFVGQELEVLIEYTKEFSKGHTDNYLEVIIKEQLVSHQIYKVKITEVKNKLIFGQLI